MSFGLKSGSESLSGASVSLICTLDRYTDIISIFKSDDKTVVATAFSRCNQTYCRNLNPSYIFTVTGNTVEITIKSLQRAEDQKWWTCRTISLQAQRSEKQFHLTVYSEYDNKHHKMFRSFGRSVRNYICLYLAAGYDFIFLTILTTLSLSYIIGCKC